MSGADTRGPRGRRIGWAGWSPDGLDGHHVGRRFVVAALAAVEVADGNGGALLGREIERGDRDGVEGAAERFEVPLGEGADAACATEAEGEVWLGKARRRPAVLGHAGALEQAEALGSLGEGEPGANLCAVRAVAAVRALRSEERRVGKEGRAR